MTDLFANVIDEKRLKQACNDPKEREMLMRILNGTLPKKEPADKK